MLKNNLQSYTAYYSAFCNARYYHAVIFHFIFKLKIKGFHNPDPPRKRTIKTHAFWRQNYSSQFYFGNDSSHTISPSWFSIRIEAFYVLFKLMYDDE